MSEYNVDSVADTGIQVLSITVTLLWMVIFFKTCSGVISGRMLMKPAAKAEPADEDHDQASTDKAV